MTFNNMAVMVPWLTGLLARDHELLGADWWPYGRRHAALPSRAGQNCTPNDMLAASLSSPWRTHSCEVLAAVCNHVPAAGRNAVDGH